MLAGTKALWSAAMGACLLASPAAAQDDISLAGTLKKRQQQLTALLQGHFTNKEQAAFAPALTAEGDAPFETLYSLTITSKDGALTASSADGGLSPEMTINTAIEGETLVLKASGEKAECVGDVSPLLDGFEVTFSGRKNRTCPFGEQLTVLPKGLQLTATEDRPALPMMRAQDFSCWVTLPRKNGEGWFFKAGVPLHDQGGEIWVDTDETPPQRVGLKMRQAVWPYGRSRPSLVLYIHKPESPDKAASYTWANPEAERIGINLRWMQASCTKAGAS